MINKKVLHNVIASIAREQGESIAIEERSKSFNYRELESYSNQLSNCLLQHGMTPGAVGAVYIGSGINYVSSLLGINKAGGLFMPLELSYPVKRLQYLIEYVCPNFLITEERNISILLDQLPSVIKPKVKVLIIKEEGKFITAEIRNGQLIENSPTEYSKEAPKVEVDGDWSNYLLYTSGSTGFPKIIEGSHKSLSHFIHWEKDEFKLDKNLRVSQLAPTSFDVSLRDIFLPLLSGGTLCVPEKVTKSDPEKLLKWIGASKVNLIHTVPSMFRLLTKELKENVEMLDEIKSLKYVFLAGEAVYGKDIAAWREVVGDEVEIVNLYGPTETTLAKIFNRIEELPEDLHSIIPLGKPITNTAALIINNKISSNIGEIGEIYIKTPFRSKGYYKNSEMTLEKFVQNPLHNNFEDIVYKTGDLGKYLKDGRIAFAGRQDSQVKIRGNRVELTEVERVLAGFSEIDQVVVLPIKKFEGEDVLACYYTEKESIEEGSLKNYILDYLPEYMHPSYYIKLEEFPLNLNGKIDKRVLPPPEDLIYEQLEFQSAENDIESEISKIWSEVLGLKKVGVTNSFFELGGHSLSATKVISRIYKHLGKEVGLKDFFDHSTVRKLSNFLKKEERLGYDAIKPIAIQSYYDLSNAQKRLWVIDQLEGASGAYNITSAYKIEGKINVESLAEAIDQLVERHESLRTIFMVVDGDPKQKVLAPENFNFDLEVVELSENELERLIDEESVKPFDIAEGPLLRVKLFKVNEEDSVLLFTIHHIISDALSMKILSEETLKVYHSIEKQQPALLSPLPVQYKDYCSWLNNQLSEEKIKTHKSYWLNRFSGELPVLEFPTDFVRPVVKTFNGDCIKFDLDKGLYQNLKELTGSNDVSFFTTVLATVKALVFQYTGVEDIIIGSPVSGRNHPDLEGQIGFYVNTLALKTKFDAKGSFKNLLTSVKETVIQGLEHQLYPFDHLVEDLALGGDFSRSPLFDISVVLHDSGFAFGNTLSSEIEATPFQVDSKKSKFDLTFTFNRTEDGLGVIIEYNTDLFTRKNISRLAQHYQNLVRSICSDPLLPINELQYLSVDELNQILYDFNDTNAPFSGHLLMNHLFEKAAEENPAALALVCGGKTLTYQELNEKANQLASLLKSREIGKGDCVGVLLERSNEMIIAVMGILKSGAAYVPFEVTFPSQRIQKILLELNAPCVITQYSQMPIVRNFQWQLPALKEVVCLDIETAKLPVEPLDAEAVKSLWDHWAENANDKITAGGFIDSYTGNPFDEGGVDQYKNYVVSLLKPYLGKDKKILEIGCGAGTIMFEVAPYVQKYIGLDPSEITQYKNKNRIKQENWDNILLEVGFAHELQKFEKNSLDIILLASTVQFFPGITYLENAIEQAMELLVPGGVVVVADVMDIRQKENLIQSINEYRKSVNIKGNENLKNDFNQELYVDRDVFEALKFENSSIEDLQFFYREDAFENELRFRYDLSIKKITSSSTEKRPLIQKRNIWTTWHTNGFPKSNFDAGITSLDLAYVLYTSGSTGKPKGVMVQHKPAINLIEWVNKTYNVGIDDNLLFVTSLCFDLSVYDVFGVLGSGGTLYIATHPDIQNPQKLLKILLNNPITFWDSAPAIFSQLIPHLPLPIPNHSLRLVFLSGDFVPLELPEKIVSKFPKTEVINLGGATETTIWSSWHPIKKIHPSWKSYPYGKPIQNVKYYILDSSLRPCPIGIPGELYVGGECLAVGYVKQPDLTAEKFITKIFSPTHQEVIYRTGDIARWYPDGDVELLGRKDNQLKVRGYRVELGEIESTLLKIEGVKNALVTTKLDKQGDKELVAYFISDKDHEVSDLRAFLGKSLPHYMIPSYFVALKSFPLNSNGKIDRKALPAPESLNLNKDKDYVAPRNTLEENLVEIWKDIFNKENIGIRDSFFNLGGHSLKALQMVSKIYKKMELNIEMKDIYEELTIENIARKIQTRSTKGEIFFPTIYVDAENKHEWFELSDIQQAYWAGRSNVFELGNVATHLYYEIDYENLDINKFLNAIERVVQRHPMLRAVFNEQGQQKISTDKDSFKVKVDDLRNLNDEEKDDELNKVREMMSHQILDYRKGLFEIRVNLIHETKTRVHFSFDALIGDAWSIMIIKRDFESLYLNPEIVLPELELTFRDYIIAEKKFEGSSFYKKSKHYWLERLDDMPPAPMLPVLKANKEIDNPKYINLSSELSKEKWDLLKKKAAEHQVTPTSLLLSAFSEVLALWSKRQAFTINLTLFNRLPIHHEIAEIVGDFTSLTLLSVHVDNTNSFIDRTIKLQKQLIQDLEYRYFSGVRVIRELAKKTGSMKGAIMPVVFTSTLSFEDSSGEDETKDLTAEEAFRSSQTSQVWLDHQVGESYGKLTFLWTVIEDLFPDGMVQDMFETYCNLLEKLMEEDSWHEKTFNLLPKPQKVVFDAVNSTYCINDKQRIIDLINDHLENSTRIAISTINKDISYKDLFLYTNRIGNWLKSKGVETNQLVAIIMEKGWEQIAAVLGTMKSGAAYLPIDINWPKDRILYLLENGDVKQIITQSKHIPNLDLPDRYEILGIDEMNFLQLNAAPVNHTPKPEDLAYVIFTSGSTGVPKGVMIDYRGMENTIFDINQRFFITFEDKVLAVSSLSFDLSVYDIFGTLAAGGTIVIPNYSVEPNPSHWLSLIEKKGVTVWNSAPALMEMLLNISDQYSNFSSLRLVMMSGDWIPVSLPDQLKERNSNVEIVSLGGATEASIWSILFPVKEVKKEWKSIPYGKPMLNQQFYVLNDHYIQCPFWVTGQLYIAGAGLAKGYWKDPLKTSGSFITHPVTQERLYKTGDLGRYLPDGNIEFTGREDNQVKIRGHRIELGEIEEILRKHPEVKDTVVTVIEDEFKNKLLAAYYVLNSNDEGKMKKSFSSQTSSLQKEFKLSTFSSSIRKVKSKTAFKNDGLTFNQISTLLASLMELKFKDLPLPKYRYPSAGSLYPVQVYLHINSKKISEMKGGFYYYSPSSHELTEITSENLPVAKVMTESLEESSFSIFLVGKLSAIQPVYGELSQEFCYLEAGYIQQLLQSTASNLHINLIQNFVDNQELKQLLDLPADHIILGTLTSLLKEEEDHDEKLHELLFMPEITSVEQEFHKIERLLEGVEKTEFKLKNNGLRNFNASARTIELSKPVNNEEFIAPYLTRQSFRIYQDNLISFDAFAHYLDKLIDQFKKSSSPLKNLGGKLQPYFYIKSNKIECLQEGFYILDIGERALRWIDTDRLHPKTFLDNKTIFDNGAFALFISAENKVFDSRLVQKLQYLAAGSIGQFLMDETAVSNIGLCPLGGLETDSLEKILQLSKEQTIIHSFIGGAVGAEQMNTLELSGDINKTPNVSKVLKEYLKDKLPSYMVPLFFQEIEHMPLNSNGKLDRKLLPKPSLLVAEQPRNYVAPSTFFEEKLVQIWINILEKTLIGIYDNFFDLGGDSLRATQVVSHVYKELNVKLDLRMIYETNNIYELAKEVEAIHWISNGMVEVEGSEGFEKLII